MIKKLTKLIGKQVFVENNLQTLSMKKRLYDIPYFTTEDWMFTVNDISNIKGNKISLKVGKNL